MIRNVCTMMVGLLLVTSHSHAQSIYFPPINNSAVWESISPASLNWCEDKIDDLYDFLEQQNTKGFIVLKDGKIVLEKYFGTFTQDSAWYWASAGKTITAFLVGKAQEDGALSIDDPVSDYLGGAWTNCTAEEEAQIKIVHQLTMTTGLNDGVMDNHCTDPNCLEYLAAPGARWAYHNAPYTLLGSVVSAATGLPINSYTQQKLKNPTGMTGIWVSLNYDRIFFSTLRSMARFGLLAQNEFVWDGTPLLTDANYIQQMTNTSQSLNESYGYLWWLNGKDSYMVPTVQVAIPGELVPHSPEDMFAGLGANGQVLSISRSSGLVIVRMGNSPGTAEISSVLADQIWERVSDLTCNASHVSSDVLMSNTQLIYPNPANTEVFIKDVSPSTSYHIFDVSGRVILSSSGSGYLDVSTLREGYYCIRFDNGVTRALLIQH